MRDSGKKKDKYKTNKKDEVLAAEESQAHPKNKNMGRAVAQSSGSNNDGNDQGNHRNKEDLEPGNKYKVDGEPISESEDKLARKGKKDLNDLQNYATLTFAASLYAAAFTYNIYYNALYHINPAIKISWQSFFSYPQEWISNETAFYSQVVIGAVIIIAVFVINND
ncbi:hypothetical protein PG991_009291 [Apiospora marii]|uniref:Uncharacterized protein n=1 Tax=Apiospora marii TaxID=335849 RepID=A0ABR1RKI8_9PEZI